QTEILPPVEPEDLRRSRRLRRALLRRAKWCGLATRKIEHANFGSFGLELGNRTSHAELGVVGVRGDDENVEHRLIIRAVRLDCPVSQPALYCQIPPYFAYRCQVSSMPSISHVSPAFAQRPLFLGFDVGGTGIKLGIVDDLGRPLAQTRVDTLEEQGPQSAVVRARTAVNEMLAEVGLTIADLSAVGLATPGNVA